MVFIFIKVKGESHIIFLFFKKVLIFTNIRRQIISNEKYNKVNILFREVGRVKSID